MADDKRDSPRPFDVRTVEYLLKLMTDHDLSEIDLREGELRIRMRKGGANHPVFVPAPAPPVAAVPHAAANPGHAAGPAPTDRASPAGARTSSRI